jgi:AcrR family transcriptional regulator
MADGEGSRADIMTATQTALCKYGYADLTFDRIAAEFDKSRSLIAYHFDTKDALIAAFLDHMQEQLQECVAAMDAETPEERIDRLLDLSLAIDSEEIWHMRKAFMEMAAQGPYDSDIARKYTELDDFMHDLFSNALTAHGVDNPDRQAVLLLSAIDGFMHRKIGRDDTNGREQFKEQLQQTFLATER